MAHKFAFSSFTVRARKVLHEPAELAHRPNKCVAGRPLWSGFAQRLEITKTSRSNFCFRSYVGIGGEH